MGFVKLATNGWQVSLGIFGSPVSSFVLFLKGLSQQIVLPESPLGRNLWVTDQFDEMYEYSRDRRFIYILHRLRSYVFGQLHWEILTLFYLGFVYFKAFVSNLPF